MKTLHVYRSRPNTIVQELSRRLITKGEQQEFKLYVEDVDYDKLVENIFDYEHVIFWW